MGAKENKRRVKGWREGWDGMVKAEWVDVWAHVGGVEGDLLSCRRERSKRRRKETNMRTRKSFGCNLERRAWPGRLHDSKRQGDEYESLKAS